MDRDEESLEVYADLLDDALLPRFGGSLSPSISATVSGKAKELPGVCAVSAAGRNAVGNERRLETESSISTDDMLH